MKNRIIAFILLVSCLFALTSCSVLPVYNSPELVAVLERYNYEITDVDEEVQEGIVGYVYGFKESTGDEIYYIYCEDVSSARSVYNYIKTTQKAKIAAIKMEIDKVEYALYKSEGVSASEKGDYYERYVELTEQEKKYTVWSKSKGVQVVGYYESCGHVAQVDDIVYTVSDNFDYWIMYNGEGVSGFLCVEPQAGKVNGLNIPDGYKVLAPDETVTYKMRFTHA